MHRVLPIGLAAAAIAALVVACLSHRWWVPHIVDDPSLARDEGFGLLQHETHVGEDTIRWNHDAVELMNDFADQIEAPDVHRRDEAPVRGSPLFAPIGIATFGALLLGVAGLVVAAARVLLRAPVRAPVYPTIFAYAGFIAAAIGVLAMHVVRPDISFPGSGGFAYHVHWPFWVFWAAAIAALVAARLLDRRLRAVDDPRIARAELV
jgi:hypothetical protein